MNYVISVKNMVWTFYLVTEGFEIKEYEPFTPT